MASPAITQPLGHATRTQVFTALFTLLQTLAPPPGFSSWKTFSQDIQSWDDFPAASQPALFLARGPQIYAEKAYGATKLTWKLYIWVYFRTDGLHTKNTYPSQVCDPVMDSIEQLFIPPAANSKFTLGGLVQNCWLEGPALAEPGVTDNQAVIVVPVNITL